MQNRSEWTTIGVAVATGLLVILLLPFGWSLIANTGGTGQRPADQPSRGVLATLEHWLDRAVHLDFTGPRGLFADSSGFNLLLIAAIVVMMFVVVPRLALLVLGVVAGLVLLGSIFESASGPQSRSPGGNDFWSRLFEPGLFGPSMETLLLIGILVTIGFVVMQRGQREESLNDSRYRSGDER